MPPPSHLTAQVLSPVEVLLSWKDEATDETEVRVEVRAIDGEFEDVGAVAANATAAILQGLKPATRYVFRVRAGRLGIFSAYSNETEGVTGDATVFCMADAWTLCLQGHRFRVRVSWSGADGLSRRGLGSPFLAGDSGLFWFFEPDNLELVVKVLDACAGSGPGGGPGGRFWVFAGAATNLQYVLTVTDTLTGRVRVYFHPRGTPPVSVTDTEAFPCR